MADWAGWVNSHVAPRDGPLVILLGQQRACTDRKLSHSAIRCECLNFQVAANLTGVSRRSALWVLS
ncbi:MAG: hypothetical protein HIU84_02345 [Acidobacteria bacterium]|nr:hypothetical protein [Acidobacteriota bacterium]